MGLRAVNDAHTSAKADIHLLMVTGNSLSAVLEQKGYRSVGIQSYLASRISDIKKLLTKHSIDVILIDWEYNSIDPFEIMNFLASNKTYKHIPIVVTSIHRCDDRIGKFDGVALFVKQPVPRVLLLERIRRLLQKKSREKKRVAFQEFYLGSVKVQFGDVLLTMSLADISISGIFLYSEKTLEKGQEVQLNFSLPGIEKPLDIEGKVSRVSRKHKINDKMNKGIAIHFTKFNGQTEEVLKAFLKEHKPESDFMPYYL